MNRARTGHRTTFAVAATAWLGVAVACFAGPASAVVEPVAGESIVNVATFDEQTTPTGNAVARIDGGYVVAWETFDPLKMSTDVLARRLGESGAASAAPFAVGSVPAVPRSEPAIAALTGGGFVVAWRAEGGDGDAGSIVGRIFDVAGAPSGPEFAINATSASEQARVRLAPSPSGFVATWQSRHREDSDFDVYVRTFGADGTATSTERRANTTLPFHQRNPDVAVRSDGIIVVSWWSQNATNSQVVIRRFDASLTPVGGELAVSIASPDGETDTALAATDDDGVLIAWRSFEQGAARQIVLARRVNRDGTVPRPPVALSFNATADSGGPDLVALADNHLLASWHEAGADAGPDIVLQRIGADATPAEPPLSANVATAFGQRQASLATGNDGSIVAVWNSDSQDGSGSSVVARGFEVPVVQCGDATLNNGLTASDALATLLVAVGRRSCELCICDVDNSGSIVATDALIILAAVVAGEQPTGCAPCT